MQYCYHIKYLKYTKYRYSIFSLIVVIYENRYDQHKFFWYYRPSIIDPFTVICHVCLLYNCYHCTSYLVCLNRREWSSLIFCLNRLVRIRKFSITPTIKNTLRIKITSMRKLLFIKRLTPRIITTHASGCLFIKGMNLNNN